MSDIRKQFEDYIEVMGEVDSHPHLNAIVIAMLPAAYRIMQTRPFDSTNSVDRAMAELADAIAHWETP